MSPDVSPMPDPSSTVVDRADDPPFERIDGDRAGGLLLLCDHASNRVPPPYGDLGLASSAFSRHIAYDIGARSIELLVPADELARRRAAWKPLVKPIRGSWLKRYQAMATSADTGGILHVP